MVDSGLGRGAHFTYQWLRDGKNIAGATSPVYLLTNADVGKAISVRVLQTTDEYGNPINPPMSAVSIRRTR